MSEGWKRATLAAVCSRAPWGGTVTRGWGAEPKAWTLTEDEVRATYAAIVEGKGKAGICAALAVEGLSEDKASRCLQMLRKAKLIKYVTGVGWVSSGWTPPEVDNDERDRQGTTSQKQRGEPVALQDWEPRALPSEARCRVWAEEGGTWHLTTNATDGAFCMARGVRSGYPSDADKPLWRPWKDNNPAPWSEFYAATHPPIPEGLERIGEWRTGLGAPRDLPLVFLEDGTIMRDPGLILGSVWFCEVRRVPPPTDWGDVPKGVDLRPSWGCWGPCNNVILSGAYVGRVFDQSEEGYSTHGTNQRPVEGSPFASLPAAIVALTGRRTG